MAMALEQLTKEAMNLPVAERLALAELLLESSDGAENLEAEVAWDAEIRARIRAIEEGRETGVPYADVLRAAEARLAP